MVIDTAPERTVLFLYKNDVACPGTLAWFYYALFQKLSDIFICCPLITDWLPTQRLPKWSGRAGVNDMWSGAGPVKIRFVVREGSGIAMEKGTQVVSIALFDSGVNT